MKHGILAHQHIDTTTPVELYTFAGAAAYVAYVDDGIALTINELKLLNHESKHLANLGDVISATGTGTVLLEGIEQ